MNGKKFANIDVLVDDIAANYRGATFGNRFDGKYCIVSVGDGTPESIIERLARKKTKLIYLIAEETDG